MALSASARLVYDHDMRRSTRIVAAIGVVCIIPLAIARFHSAGGPPSRPATDPQVLVEAALGRGGLKATAGSQPVTRPTAAPASPRPPRAALSRPADAACEAAALELIKHPKAATAMVRQVLRETPSPRARAVAALGLGRREDWESVDDLVAALEDGSLVVRTRAIGAIRRILHNPYLAFRPDGSARERAAALQRLRRECAFAQKAHAVKQWYLDRGLFPGTRGPDGRPLCPLAREGRPEDRPQESRSSAPAQRRGQ